LNDAPDPLGKLRVELGDRAYDIVVGDNLLGDAAHHLHPLLQRPKVAVITDETVADHHLPTLRDSLRGHSIACSEIIIPAGEGTKNFTQLADIVDRLLDLEIERNDVIVALGGGVVGDLVGFAAAILRRGIDYVQIPTTLLAQVDSSVGGKTAINVRQGKNLVGAFHQPQLVLADVGTLDTLPKRELLAGYAEVVKYGLLGSLEFFEWLEANGAALIEGDRLLRREAVLACCRMKAEIVAQDEREAGIRALLNLGHTFGHAYEAEAGYDGLLHGEGVAVGMRAAFELSRRLEHCSGQDVERMERHFADIGLPLWPGDIDLGDVAAERLFDHMFQDKKVSDGRLTFILANGIGSAFVSRDVSDDAVLSVLRDGQRVA
jgi:3-dehydroquinate synthase